MLDPAYERGGSCPAAGKRDRTRAYRQFSIAGSQTGKGFRRLKKSQFYKVDQSKQLLLDRRQGGCISNNF